MVYASMRGTVIALTACLGACAAGAGVLSVTGEASGTANFELGRPVAYAAGEGAEIVGVACRRGATTLLPPGHVRIEHLSAAGESLHIARAYLPPLSRRAAERCSHYSVRVEWRPANGETLRACFDRGHACGTAK